MATRKQIAGIGYSIAIAFGVVLLVAGVMFWVNSASPGPLLGFVVFTGNILFVCLAIGTTTHLWSLVPTMPEGSPTRRLFKIMGVSFLFIAAIFMYNVINTMQGYAGVQTITLLINSSPDPSLREVIFPLFNILKISMPLDSIVQFALIMMGVSVLIYPLERHVKGRKPWFSISMWIALCIIPVIIPFRENITENVNVSLTNTWVLSIATAAIVLFVVINFIYMFYLYISLAVATTGKMRTASILVAFGLMLMIMVWIVGMLSGDIKPYVQFATGVAAMAMFNEGFRIMRG